MDEFGQAIGLNSVDFYISLNSTLPPLGHIDPFKQKP